MKTVQIKLESFRSLTALFAVNFLFLLFFVHTSKFFFANYHWWKAIAFTKNSEYGSAIVDFQKAVRLDPHDGRLHFFYGSALLLANHLDEGIAELEKAARNFQDVFLFQNLGKAYLDKKVFDQSAYYYKKAVDSKIDYKINLNNYGVVFLNSGQWDKAIEIFKYVIALDDSYLEGHESLGLTYLNKGSYDEAIQEFKKVLSADPNRVNVLNNLGIAYMKQQKYDQAIQTFKLILGLDKMNTMSYDNIGVAFYKQGKIKEALKYWGETLKIDPDNKIALHNIMEVISRR